MTSERWQQIERLYHGALEHAPEERARFLKEACGDDQALHGEVESLLAYDEQAARFISSPPDELAAEMLFEDQAQSLIGTSLSHHQILSLLGRGGMGEVYLATDTRLARKVAIKLLPAEFTMAHDRVRRFKQEARAASSLNHPNILTIHEIGELDHRHFIVSEYVEGETLRAKMAEGRMEILAALEVAQQVASALEAAHQAGIVHRDIKPENVMVRSDSLVKVLDFGLAKLTEPPAAQAVSAAVESQAPTSAHSSTEPGMMMGTVSYMSPEQARGQKVDHRTDLFSLGIVLYEMITGRAPFVGGTSADVLAAILKDEPEILRRAEPRAPEALEWITNKALRKDREERYQTAREFLTDLKRLKQRLEIEIELERSGRPESSDEATLMRGGGATKLATDPAEGAVTSSNTTITTYDAGYLSRRARRFKLPIAVLALASLTLIGLVYWRDDGAKAIDSVAVLPFVNEGGDPNTEYLSDGITESLIRSLSQFHNLKVISRASVFRYKGREIDPKSAGRELGVRAVLMGRVKQRDDGFSISVELADAENNSHLWGQRYDRGSSGLFSVETEIVKDIAERLRLELTSEEERLLARRQVENADAYRNYLIGRYHWNKRTEEGLQKAIKYYEQAIDLEPGYALAYSGLADAYSSLEFSFDVGSLAPSEAMPKAREAATKALEIDNTLAETHTSLAFIKLNYDWDAAGAEREFKRSFELNPRYAHGHHWYSHLLTAMGRIEESLAESRRALELDQTDLIINVHLGWHFLQSRQYDQAREHLRKTLELDPNYGLTHWYLGLVYEQKAMYEEAAVELRKAMELLKGNVVVEADLGHVYAVAGRPGDAKRILDQLMERSRKRYVSPYLIAMIHAGLGDKEQAFEWLDKAYQDRSDSLVYLKVEPKLDPLRSDPRFQQLLQRVGLFGRAG